MLIDIDLSSEEPLYRQIRTQIVRGVATGELVAGDALPSVRTLAGDLGVNMHTVNKAYALLRDEGYVTIRGRSGTCIAEGAGTSTQDAAIAAEMRRLAFEFAAQGGTVDEFAELARASFTGCGKEGAR